MTKVRTKKSKASSVQPRKPARTALRWLVRSAAPAASEVERFMCGELYFPVDDTTANPHRLRRRPALLAGHDRQTRRDCAESAARARAGRRHAGECTRPQRAARR